MLRSVLSSRSKSAASLLTKIAFITKSEGKPVRYARPPADYRPNFEVSLKGVVVGDARAATEPPSIHAHGFCLRRMPSKFRKYADRDAVKKSYFPEVERIISKELDAEKVIVFNYVLLSSRLNLKSSPGADIPAFTAHNDYTSKIAPTRLCELIGAEEASKWLSKRVVQLNVWRPFNNPVEEFPLAMCDGRSISPKQLVAADLRFPDRVSEFQFLKFSKKQAWWYYPRMTPDEILIIKGYDSKPENGARWAPHAALQHREIPTAKPRETIVARAFALLSS